MRIRRQKVQHFPAVREALRAARNPPPVIDVRRTGGRPWLQWGTPTRFTWTECRLPIHDLPRALEGLRFVHLSDLHLRPTWGRGYDRLVAQLSRHPPDLILLTGDVIDVPSDLPRALPFVRRLLPALPSRLGTYAILGNHDPWLLAAYLPEMGVRSVMGRREIIVAGPTGLEGEVELIGMPGPERHDATGRFFAEMPPRRAGVPRIVLSHYPDLFAPSQSLEADIFLAGHTHGGQLCLPGGRPLLTHDRLPSRFCKGIHRLGPTWLVVSAGFGMTGVALRTFCPSEVVEVTLKGSS